mgnify:CR=1 FL=1
MILNPLFLGVSPWHPMRMISGIILGDGILPPPATFSWTALAITLPLHFLLSILYVFIGSLILWRAPKSAPVAGAFLGLLLYIINFYGWTLVFPWFEMARNWVSIVSHVLFGITTGVVYNRAMASVAADRAYT